MYQKEIIYMGLYKDESRLGSAGFLKVENRERESRMYLKIQNVPLGINGRFPIRVYDGEGWKEIDGIMVREGGGSWQESLTKPAERVILKVMLPSGYYLEGKSKTASGEDMRGKSEVTKEEDTVEDLFAVKQEEAVQEKRAVEEKSTVSEVHTAQEERAESEAYAVQEKRVESGVYAVQEERAVSEAYAVQGDGTVKEGYPLRKESIVREPGIILEESTVHKTNPAEKEKTPEKESVRTEKILVKEELPRRGMESTFTVPQTLPAHSLKEDKWEQILDTYENIHPYGDERVYVKLEPKDFVILQSKYQHLVNNSFLLHGFYNYRYIILGKEQDYYLGVPGVFYEREKMVALMFGFEAFECPGGNAKAGEFGYYLRKVEL